MTQQVDDNAACRRVWSSVIIQALIDATSQPRNPSSKVARDQAHAWLTASFGTTAQEFEEVCFLADMDPLRVRRFYENYSGPPLTVHVLSRLRDQSLIGETDAD